MNRDENPKQYYSEKSFLLDVRAHDKICSVHHVLGELKTIFWNKKLEISVILNMI